MDNSGYCRQALSTVTKLLLQPSRLSLWNPSDWLLELRVRSVGYSPTDRWSEQNVLYKYECAPCLRHSEFMGAFCLPRIKIRGYDVGRAWRHLISALMANLRSFRPYYTANHKNIDWINSLILFKNQKNVVHVFVRTFPWTNLVARAGCLCIFDVVI